MKSAGKLNCFAFGNVNPNVRLGIISLLHRRCGICFIVLYICYCLLLTGIVAITIIDSLVDMQFFYVNDAFFIIDCFTDIH